MQDRVFEFLSDLSRPELIRALRIIGDRLEHFGEQEPLPALTPEELEFVRGNRTIDAIRSIRSRMNLTLKEAKNLVDDHRARMR